MNWLREPINALTHFFAAIAGVVGLFVLLESSVNEISKQIVLLVYGLSLVLMMLTSAAYHGINGTPSRIEFLRKLDHAAIFILIAGTYTPICYIVLSGFWQDGFLLIVWGIAIIGVIFKVLFINTPNWLTIGLYLGMGWLSIIGYKEISQLLVHNALLWLIAGGIVFTVGAVIYAVEKPNLVPGVFGYHELWHLFVIAGCLCHFLLMINFIAPYSIN